MTLFRSDAFWASLIGREPSEIDDGVEAEKDSKDGSSARTTLAGSSAEDFAAAPAIGAIRTQRHHLTINLLGSINVLAGDAIRVR
jgi:hypothetical protein